jgi:outer membrane receptor protein involved in Fe transport
MRPISMSRLSDMRRRGPFGAGTAALAVLAWAPTLLGAQSASVTGTVYDADAGVPLLGATVVLQGTPLSTRSDGDGRFAIGRLDAGRYTLVVVAVGFAADSLTEVVLAEGEWRVVTLSLRPVPLMLPELVISPARTVERRDQAIASVAVMAADEVLSRNVTTLDNALPYVPGITFNGNEQVDIRGAAGMARGIGSRVLMLLDGHPILTGDGAEVDFRVIPLLDLERTEVVKGAYSAVYGSNALGGVINLVTAPVEREPQTAVRVHGGGFNYRPEHRWADGVQATAGVGIQHSRAVGAVGARAFLGYEDTDGYAENGESSRWIGRLKLSSHPSSRRPWDAYALVARERAGEAFVWRSQDEPFRVPEPSVGNHTVNRTILTGASVTPYARATTLVRLSPYFNVNGTENFFDDNDDWHTAIKPGLLAELAWYAGRRHAFSFGVEAAHTWVRSNFLGQPRLIDVAAFAQDEFQLSANLKTTLGVRLDHHKANLAAGEWAISPKVGAALQLGPAATLRASAGAGYRAPSAIEQFVSSQQFGFRVVPNLELEGEHAWSAEVGTSVRLVNRVRVDAAAFGSLYADLISPAPSPLDPFVFQFQNVARARVAGFDVGVNAQLVPDALELGATYLWLDTEDRDTGAALPYRARHNVTVTLDVLRGLAGLDLRHRSRIEEVLVYPLDPRSHMTVVDLRLGYRVLNVLWQLKVANLFNEFYVDVQERNPGAPRSIALTGVYGL